MSDITLTPTNEWIVTLLPYPCPTDGFGNPNPPAAFVGPINEGAIALVFGTDADDEKDPFNNPSQREYAYKISAMREMYAALQAQEAANAHEYGCETCRPGNGVVCLAGMELELNAIYLRKAALAKAVPPVIHAHLDTTAPQVVAAVGQMVTLAAQAMERGEIGLPKTEEQ